MATVEANAEKSGAFDREEVAAQLMEFLERDDDCDAGGAVSGMFRYAVENGTVTITGIQDGLAGAVSIPGTIKGLPVTAIGENAFAGCRTLTGVAIPDSVTDVMKGAFSGCGGQVRFTVADSNPAYSSVNGMLLSKDGRTLIRGIDGHVAIPDGVVRIGEGAFAGCGGVTDVTIPDSVTDIGQAAFLNCRGLTGVTIPDGVTDIGSSAFCGCYGLATADGLVIVKDVLYDYCGAGGEVIIPDGVKRIGEWVFAYCRTLTGVTIPDSVTDIGEFSFANCPGLKSVTIPRAATIAAKGAFDDEVTIRKGENGKRS